MTLDGEDASTETLLKSFQNSPRIQERTLIIQSAKGVSHGQIVKVMDIAKRAGIQKVGFSKI